MLRKFNLGQLYNSIIQHNQSLFDYSKGESERKEIYWIYEITLPLQVHCKLKGKKLVQLIHSKSATLLKDGRSWTNANKIVKQLNYFIPEFECFLFTWLNMSLLKAWALFGLAFDSGYTRDSWECINLTNLTEVWALKRTL